MKYLLPIALFLAACDPVPPDSHGYQSQLSARHQQALKANGIKDAKPAPYSMFTCAESDSIFASAGFKAGDIEGNVCCGMLKGCTVRTK